MAAYKSPGRNDSQVKAWEMKSRLEKCWTLPLDWSLYPKHLKDVRRTLMKLACIHTVLATYLYIFVGM